VDNKLAEILTREFEDGLSMEEIGLLHNMHPEAVYEAITELHQLTTSSTQRWVG